MSKGNSRARDIRLLTEPEAAERLRICSETLARQRRAGRIGHMMIAGCVRYTDEILLRYMDANMRHQEAPSALDGTAEQSRAA